MPKQPKGVLIEYVNPEAATNPSYVDGAQGMLTREKMLHVNFISEFRKVGGSLQSSAQETEDPNIFTVEEDGLDPYPLDENGNIVVIRRIGASILVNENSLEKIVAWLQAKLVEMRSFREDAHDA